MMQRAGFAQAQLCGCPHPLLSDETCLRCGRAPALAPEPAANLQRETPTWTRAKVTRAFEAFAFFRGRPPVAADWTRRIDNWPPLETVEAIFGSIEAAAAAAGLERSVTDVAS
jgi:hypothetical protein